MKRHYKKHFKINFFSILLMSLSFMSVSLAWFAYSGIVGLSTDIDINSWYIELEKNGEPVSNNMVISLTDLYPGMQPLTEQINIKNKGDSDAQISYSIISARILGDHTDFYNPKENEITSEYVQDLLSFKYPFSINMELDKNFALSDGEDASFDISISWPLDSGNDEIDSLWGRKAYEFINSEENKRKKDDTYQMKPAIQIEISVIAEQYIEKDDSKDIRYNLGDEILIDVINNSACKTLSETCIKTNVIDINNKISDEFVNLIPSPYNNYNLSSFENYEETFNSYIENWQVNSRELLLNDILDIISLDIKDSLVRSSLLSDRIIGNYKTEVRYENILNTVKSNEEYFVFANKRFNYLNSINCYWTNTEYNSLSAFAVVKEDDNISKIYAEEKEHQCHIIPIITISKEKL